MDRGQQFLLPPSMLDWLPQDHLVWFLLEVVGQVDTSGFHARFARAGQGRAAYDPDMLLTLLIYGYCHEVRSARKIARLCETDVAFRVICAQDVPHHATLSRLVADCEDAFTALFDEVLVLCARAGLGRFGTVALDGTKIAANASAAANRSESWLSTEVARMVADGIATDAAEDTQLGDARGDELPEQLRHPRTRVDRIRRAAADVAAARARERAAERAAADRAGEYVDQTRKGEGPSPAGTPPRGVDLVTRAEAALARERARQQKKIDRYRARKAAGDPNPGRPPVTVDDHIRVREARDRLACAHAGTTGREREGKPETPSGHDGEPAHDGGTPNQKNQKNQKKQKRPPKANTTDPDSRLMPTRGGWIQGYNAQLAVTGDGLILVTKLTQDTTDSAQFEPMMGAAVDAVAHIGAHRSPHPTRPNACGHRQHAEQGTRGRQHEQHPQDGDNPDQIGWFLADAGYWSARNLTVDGPARLIACGTRRDLDRQTRDAPASGDPPADAGPKDTMRHRLRTPQGAAIYKRRGATVETANAHLKDGIGLRRFRRRGRDAAAAELDLAATAVNLTKLFRRTRGTG